MRHFTSVKDLGDLNAALKEAFAVKADRFAYQHLGKNKTLIMIFFNSSLRTRLSTQKAAMNLGMNVIVLDINQGAWKLETERGVIMDGDKTEHLLEAIPVIGCYCDVIGVRSFARFENKADDYEEKIISQFIRYSGRPVFSRRRLPATLCKVLPTLSPSRSIKRHRGRKWFSHGRPTPKRFRRLSPIRLPSG